MTAARPKFVYVTYIASTPEKVFQALTDAKISEQFWFGFSVNSDWKVGSPFALKWNGTTMDSGTETGFVLVWNSRTSASILPRELVTEPTMATVSVTTKPG